MKKLFSIMLCLVLAWTLAACGGSSDEEIKPDEKTVSASSSQGANVPESTPEPTAVPTPEPTQEPTPEPTPKTSIAIAELKEGAYAGTLSGVEYETSEKGTANAMYSTVLPADITVTIENGQITLYCEAIASAYAMLDGVKTPQTTDFSLILTGSLPLQQSGDTVTAQGEVPAQGESATVHYNDDGFERWEIKERAEGSTYTCAVQIAMENGIPVATITVGKRTIRTATVPLALASDTENAGGE